MTPTSPTGTSAESPPAAKRRLRSSVAVLLTAVFVLLLLALAAAGLWWRHGAILADAERRAETLAAIVAEHLVLRFETLEGAFYQLAAHDRLIGGPDASAQEWMPILHAAHSGLAGIVSLSVTGADGVVTYSTQPMSMGHSYAGGTLYEQLSANPMSDALAFGAVARDRTEGTVLLPVGRALRTPAGNFEGMAIALVEPASLGDLYRPLVDAPLLRIFDANGQPLVPAPHFTDPLDRPPPEIPIGQTGVLVSPVEAGGEPYVTAYRPVAETGITVAVSVPESVTLGPWWQEAAAALGAVALAGILLAVTGFGIMRSARDRSPRGQ